MEFEQTKEMLQSKEYDFLRNEPHLAGKIILLTYGGSHAYGTNVEGSDVDIRGCALNSRSDLLGLTNFEQVVNGETDTTVYSLRKLVQLLLNCNPNVIEILGCKPEHYFILTPEGQSLIDNRKLFLSKKAVNSFGGYAIQQLRRLENAIARDRLPQPKVEGHIKNAVERATKSFETRNKLSDKGSIRFYLDKAETEGLETEIFANMLYRHYPVRKFKSLLNEISNVLDDYERLNGRNHKKDEAHLNKHAMHLIRLYLMCIDILEKEEIVTYREKDRDMLLEIRAGKYMHEDGTYDQSFFDMVDEYQKRLDYAKKNTSLPEYPDEKKIEELLISLNEKALA